MRLLPVSGNFCCAQNPNFRAKFSDATLSQIFVEQEGLDFCERSKKCLDLNDKINAYGSKDTVIDIGRAVEGNYEYDDCDDAFGHDVYKNSCPAWMRAITYQNKMIPDVEYYYNYSYPTYNKSLLSDVKADDTETLAKNIGKSSIVNAEKQLVIKYVDDVIAKYASQGISIKPLMTHFKDFVTKIQSSDISIDAANVLVKYLKTMDLKEKLDKQILDIKLGKI